MAEKITIARPYSQAIYNLAHEQGTLREWGRALATSATLATNEEMIAAIKNPAISNDQLVAMFVELCGESLNDSSRNMIRVLADMGRLALLPEIETLYKALCVDAEGILSVEVISASELSDAQQAAIASALKERLKCDVTLVCRSDASLLGGAVIRIGDRVIDGSVQGRLSRLAADLMH